jgi:serine/threonine protein kinase/tetratricopeptide (TPR) repeat protein
MTVQSPGFPKRSVPEIDPLVGSQLGHYRVLERLGAGGMGVVYRAEDPRLHRRVALKLLPREDASDPAAVERLNREACAASALSHPNICIVHDLGTDKGRTFIVMELLEGLTLKDAIAARSLSLDDVVNLTLQIGDALEAAHASHIIHRDIKPGNLFITSRQRVKILDFGLAKPVMGGAEADLTGSSQALGTIAYMSPEQARGETLDCRTDLFSFGAVLYEMLTGRMAFGARTAAMMLDAVLRRVPDPPSSFDSRIPRRLDEIVARAMAKDRSRRYRSATELLEDVRALTIRRDAPAANSGTRATGRSATSRTAAGRKSDSSVKPIPSLAVLPFVNQAREAGPDADYLSDGLTESVINKLSQLPGLRVVPRTTVFRYKGKAIDPTAAAGEMKVRAVVIGRVLVRDQRLVVMVELVDVKKQAQLWGEQYNRPLADLLEVQEAMATDISRSLKLKLSGDDQKKLVKRDTLDAAAYHSYLKGRFYWNKRSAEGLLHATEHFQAAIDRDPEYALAYTGLADTFNLVGYYSIRPPAEAYPRAKAAAERALEIDDSIAEAHASLGYTRLFFDRDWAEAEREFVEAIRLKPTYPSAHQWLGWLQMVTGRHQEMVESMRRAQELDPLSLIINAHLGYALSLVGHGEDALRQLESTVGLDPGFALTHLHLGSAHLRQHHTDRAIEEYETAVRLSANRISLGLLGLAAGVAGRTARAREVLGTLRAVAAERFVSPMEFALVQAGLGDVDAAFAALDDAVGARISDLVRLHLLPWPAAVRDDPRFEGLLRRIGLTPL